MTLNRHNFKYSILFLGIFVVSACSTKSEWAAPSVTQIENPAGSGARYPSLATDSATSSLLVSWLNHDNDSTSLFWAKFDANGWTQPEEIVRGDSFFVNWADFPSITAFNGNPVSSHWLKRVPGGTYAYHINMSLYSESDGWSDTLVPHRDRSPTEHGFASFLPLDESRVFGLWLDGQNMASMSHGDMQSKEVTEHGSDLSTAMTLRSTIISAGGIRSTELQVDSSVCECCQTGITRSGNNIIAVYRNRDESETREIFKAVYSIDTDSWSEPEKLSNDNWIISGCPVNGPQIASSGDVVIATWFNAPDNQPKTSAAVSLDGGSTFGDPFLLDTETTNGRVDVTFNQSGVALLTWVSQREKSLVMGRIWENGSFLEPFIIGKINGSRASGFPRSGALGDDFLVMWTNPGELFTLVSMLVAKGD